MSAASRLYIVATLSGESVETAVRHKGMKKLVSVLSLVALLAGSAGIVAAAPAHGGGSGGFHGGGGGGFHGSGGFQGHPAFHGHGFHHGFHGRTFVGVAPFFWDPFPVYVAPPVYTAPAPYDAYWYYCPSAGGYYPYVSSCPEPWVPVPASGG